jgi:hypothetical protein
LRNHVAHCLHRRTGITLYKFRGVFRNSIANQLTLLAADI